MVASVGLELSQSLFDFFPQRLTLGQASGQAITRGEGVRVFLPAIPRSAAGSATCPVSGVATPPKGTTTPGGKFKFLSGEPTRHCHSVKDFCKYLSKNCMYKVNTMLIYHGDAKHSILRSCLPNRRSTHA